MKIDSSSPDFLVYLLSSLYDRTVVIQSPGALRHKQPKILTGGPFPSHPDPLVNVLDALASFCVFKASEQVTAVSASLTPKGTKLWIAQNEPVPIEVEEHIENLWSILSRLAASIPPQPSPPDQDSPDPNQTNDTLQFIDELRLNIYRFSFAKVRQRLLKHQDEWLPVLVSMENYTPPGPQIPDNLDFKWLARKLKALFDTTPPEIPLDKAVGYFTRIANSTHYRILSLHRLQ
jgi:hypothetical protein